MSPTSSVSNLGKITSHLQEKTVQQSRPMVRIASVKQHDIIQHYVVGDFLCFYFVKAKII